MRDLPEKKFLRAAHHMGFGQALQATIDGLRFVADDGLRVEPVLHPGTVRVDRRSTLARMSAVRKRHPRTAKSEATGAATPMASV